MGTISDVVIRVDGSAAIGMGHVVRTLSLAHAFRAAGVGVEFLTREDGGAITLIDAMGFPYTLAVRGASDGSLDEDDVAIVVDRARVANACVVIDHYGAGEKYFKSLANAGLSICAIDDLAERHLAGVRWILNPNPGISASAYPQHAQNSLLLGGRYALLRNEFGEAHSRLDRRFSETDNRVLVTFGGGSVNMYSDAVVEALRVRRPTLEIRVPDAADATEMVHLMNWADISINAGGQTCWELACLGVPMVAVQISENQIRNVVAVERFGVGASAGKWGGPETAELAADLALSLLDDPERRQSCSSAGRSLIDGNGPFRTARKILERSDS